MKRIFIKQIIFILFIIFSITNNVYAENQDFKPFSFNLGFQLSLGFPETDFLKWGFCEAYNEYKNTGWLLFLRGGTYIDLMFNFNEYYSLGTETGVFIFTLDLENEYYIFLDFPVNLIFRINMNKFFISPYGGFYFMNWNLEEWMRLYDIGGKIGFFVPKRRLRLYTDVGYVFGEFHFLRIALGLNVQLY